MPRAFGVPPPWNPGYALPAYVDEIEDLGHGALVTQPPRQGFYDIPRSSFVPGPAFNPGYSIPKNVRDEVPGQGTLVTRWLPRGTFFTASRPLAHVGVQPGLSGVDDVGDGGGAVTEYGRRSARAVLEQVMRLPPAQRIPTIKLILDKIDTSLWRRAEAEGRKFVRAGAAPLAALEAGLAVAMSAGVVDELKKVGRSSRLPGPKSLVGMGCFGCAAVLGDVVEALGAVTTRTGGGTSGTRDASGGTGRVQIPASSGGKVVIGPFVFAAGGSEVRPQITVHTANLPPAWKDYFAKETKRVSQASKSWGSGVAIPGAAAGASASVKMVSAGSLGLDKWFGLPSDYPVTKSLFDGALPLSKSKDPATGEDMGLYMIASPSSFSVWYRPVPPPKRSRWKRAWDSIKNLPGQFWDATKAIAGAAADAAGRALDKVAQLGCQLVSSPAGQMAAGAAGGPAGAAGAAAAAGACSGPPPPPEQILPAAPPPPSFPILPLAIAGGAVAFVVLSRRS